MSDLILRLAQYAWKTYRLFLIILVLLLAATVWALAHFASEPGTEVKVLWGLVEYTKTAPANQQSRKYTPDNPIQNPTKPSPVDEQSSKPAPDNPIQNPTKPSPPSQASKSNIFFPINLDVLYGLTPDNYIQKIEALRTQHNLRELRPIESDRPLRDSAPGVYSFVFVPTLARWVREKDILNARSDRRNRGSGARIEAHHRNSGQFILLAFVSETDGDRIRTLDGQAEYKITIAPIPWGQLSTLVELPMSRIIRANDRELDIGEMQSLLVLDLAIR